MESFFFGEGDLLPKQLCVDLQFVVVSETKMMNLRQNVLLEYPAKNIFPPFWKFIKNLQVDDSELGMIPFLNLAQLPLPLAMRAVIVETFVAQEVNLSGKKTVGLSAFIGDASGGKIRLFFIYDASDSEEVEAKNNLGKKAEILLGGGKIIGKLRYHLRNRFNMF